MVDTTVVIAAAGRSERFFQSARFDAAACEPLRSKIYLPLHGKQLWQYSVDRFREVSRVGGIYLVIAAEDVFEFETCHRDYLTLNQVSIVAGGQERWASVRNAIARIKTDTSSGKNPLTKLIAIHDAARPCISNASIEEVLQLADEFGAAILAIPVFGTVKRTNAERVITETISRSNLYQATTPQVFRRDWLAHVYSDEFLSTHNLGGTVTDDAQLMGIRWSQGSNMRGSSKQFESHHWRRLGNGEHVSQKSRSLNSTGMLHFLFRKKARKNYRFMQT